MKKDSLQKDNPSKYYSMNEFLKGLKKLSVNDNLENKAMNHFNSINNLNTEFQKRNYQTPLLYKSEMRK